MNCACSLDGKRVITREGEKLGHVFDLRCEPRHRGARVTHLVYGRRGFLERIGLREPSPLRVRWSDVMEIRDDAIIVAKGGKP